MVEQQKGSDRPSCVEERYTSLIENMPSAVAVYQAVDDGADFIFVEFNSAAESVENIKRDQVIGKRVTEAFPSAKSFGIVDVFERVWRTGETERFPIKLYKDDRIVGWRDNRIYRLPSGEIVAIYEDVGEKVSLQEELTTILSTMTSGILVADPETRRFVRCNRAMTDILGMPEDEVLSLSVENIHPPDALERTLDNFRKMANGELDFASNIPVLQKDGQILWTDIRTRYLELEGKRYLLGNFTDVTGRKKIEDELKDTAERLDQIVSNIEEVFWLHEYSPDGEKCLYISPSFERIWGCNLDDLYRDAATWFNMIHPDDRERVGKIYTSFTRGEGPFDEEYRIVIPDGTVRWVHDKGVHLPGVGGTNDRGVGTVLDITERRRAIEALINSEEKYRTLVETASDAILIIDIESQEIVDANDVAASLLGVPRQKAIGMRHRDLHPEDQGEKCEMMMRKAARTGDAMQHVTYICDQSRCVPVHVNATPMELNGRQVMVSIVRDITEFVSEEEKLRRGQDLLRREMMERREQLAEMRKKLEDSRRLSDIGTLAASIAHELRNPLGVIRLAAFNIQKKVKDNSCDRSFRTIDLKIEESSQIIRNLLSYARVQNVEYGKLFIKDVIEEGVDQVMHKHHRNKVKFECDSECCEGVSMQADRVSVLELLFNLFDNAAQAYEDHQGVVKVVCRVKDEHAVIKVIDNGEGMDAETLTKIFDPFFTKRTYGIGLGMNVCKRIIDLHGGTIDVKSAKGEGTTVTVTLPLLQQG